MWEPGGRGVCIVKDSKAPNDNPNSPRKKGSGDEGTSKGGDDSGAGCTFFEDGSKVCLRLPGPDPNNSIILPVVTEEDFEEFGIPPSIPHAWPVDWGISFRKTAFYADSSTRFIEMELLGIPVTVKAVPVSYRWNFGDGQQKTTKHPGNKPDDIEDARVFNVYEEPGYFDVSVSTRYRGFYRVAGGPWLAIDGQAEVPSSAVSVTIYRFHKYLVYESCAENPAGTDCPQT